MKVGTILAAGAALLLAGGALGAPAAKTNGFLARLENLNVEDRDECKAANAEVAQFLSSQLKLSEVYYFFRIDCGKRTGVIGIEPTAREHMPKALAFLRQNQGKFIVGAKLGFSRVKSIKIINAEFKFSGFVHQHFGGDESRDPVTVSRDDFSFHNLATFGRVVQAEYATYDGGTPFYYEYEPTNADAFMQVLRGLLGEETATSLIPTVGGAQYGTNYLNATLQLEGADDFSYLAFSREWGAATGRVSGRQMEINNENIN